jgi:RNA recognition motif-containing protein
MVGSRVYVGGLPYGTRERDLEKFFKGYGRTRDILIKNGYGFVEFEDYRDADDAVYELNGKELLGERWDQEKKTFVAIVSNFYANFHSNYNNYSGWLLNPREGQLVEVIVTDMMIVMEDVGDMTGKKHIFSFSFYVFLENLHHRHHYI